MKLKLFTVAALLFAMTSCGSKSEKEETSKVETTEMSESSDENRYADDYSNAESDATNEEDATDAASSDVEDMLDEYEHFVDKYIAMARKAAKGDISAATNYASIMESAQSLGDKLEKYAGSMNAAQAKRYMDITSKMANAASDIAGDASETAASMASQIDNAMEMVNSLNF